MKKPRILFYDLETSPNLAYVWGMYEQNVIKVHKDKIILSLAWKFQGDSAVQQMSYDPKTYSDLAIAKKLHQLFSEADIVVAHNGDKFDRRMANGRMLLNGLKPPADYRTVDTLKVARKQFSLNSNGLNNLAQALGVGRKAETGGFDLWLGCMKGEKAAMAKMGVYNKRDVSILERVYNALLPWINNHPNVGTVLGNKTACPNCGSVKSSSNGRKYTNSVVYQQRRCTDCQASYKGPKVAA